jgi:hypothetical protein
MDVVEMIEAKYRVLAGRLDEATLRLWAAVEARTMGRGGVSAVAKAVGISRTTVYAGMAELAAAGPSPKAVGTSTRRVRAEGGGRKKLTLKDTTLLQDLDALVEPTHVAIRSRRCAGHAKARLGWPRSRGGWITRSVSVRCASC